MTIPLRRSFESTPLWTSFLDSRRSTAAAIGALVVGLADNFGKALFPEISYFTLYAPMALILAVKPTGLLGRE